jgi:hypothetical protein
MLCREVCPSPTAAFSNNFASDLSGVTLSIFLFLRPCWSKQFPFTPRFTRTSSGLLIRSLNAAAANFAIALPSQYSLIPINTDDNRTNAYRTRRGGGFATPSNRAYGMGGACHTSTCEVCSSAKCNAISVTNFCGLAFSGGGGECSASCAIVQAATRSAPGGVRRTGRSRGPRTRRARAAARDEPQP